MYQSFKQCIDQFHIDIMHCICESVPSSLYFLQWLPCFLRF